MNLDPFTGDVVMFIGRNRRRIKVLYADSTGMWVSSKLFTLEAIKTKFNFLSEPMCDSITQGELALLLEGSRYVIEKRVAHYTKSVDQKGVSIDSPPSS